MLFHVFDGVIEGLLLRFSEGIRASLMSSSSSLHFCFDLKFFMNLMKKAIERINFVQFENLLTSIRHLSFDVSIETFVSSLLPKEFFQWLSGSLRKAGSARSAKMITPWFRWSALGRVIGRYLS